LEDEKVVDIVDSVDQVSEAPVIPDVVPEVDKRLEDLVRQNQELANQVQQYRNLAPTPVQVPQNKEPTLDECNYDPQVFTNKMREYIEQELQTKERTKQGEAHVRTVSEKYQNGRKVLNKSDYLVAETLVSAELSLTQQGILLEGCDDPASLVYALGSNRDALKKLSSISNSTAFSFAVAKMEDSLKKDIKGSSKVAPTPDTPNKGSAVGNSDSELERLRSIAAKTNDYTNVIAYKRSRRS